MTTQTELVEQQLRDAEGRLMQAERMVQQAERDLEAARERHVRVTGEVDAWRALVPSEDEEAPDEPHPGMFVTVRGLHGQRVHADARTAANTGSGDLVLRGADGHPVAVYAAGTWESVGRAPEVTR